MPASHRWAPHEQVRNGTAKGRRKIPGPSKSTSILIILPGRAAYVLLRYLFFRQAVQESFRQLSVRAWETPAQES